MNEIDFDQLLIFVRHNILSESKCKSLIRKIEEMKPSPAPINTISGTRINPEVRNNERVMFDDKDFATFIFDRVKNEVPQTIHNWHLLGANERFRCYRYKPGMRFAPHRDGPFVRDENERSYYSFLIYLNEDFQGGETTFLVEPETSITPETGMALFFQHPILHEGSVVTSGTKYVLRTDLMYRLVKNEWP